MNFPILILEYATLALALGVLLIDLWTPAEHKRFLGYGAALGLAAILVYSFIRGDALASQYAFGHAYVLDTLALFFKRFFLLAGIIVLIMSVDFADRIESGIAEFYSLTLFALTGMLLAASANDFAMLFVSVELITITFYILASFLRRRIDSLEAGIKYLILGALSTAITIYGIALVFGTSNTLSFEELANTSAALAGKPLFLLGLFLVLAGLGFKIAAFPMQVWVPDVYQGAPTPTTAFLAVGSKAAGFVLLLRLLFTAVPQITAQWVNLLVIIAAITILYGNLCAIPQRNIKRLLGYSSIAHAGYLLVGVAAMAATVTHPNIGASALLFYLGGYLFTVLTAFTVLALVVHKLEVDDISSLAGLNQRSPFLAAAMTLSMVSLAGIPPLAGFFGKFLIFKAAIEQGSVNPHLYTLVAIAVVGAVISIWYYFGVIRAIYWSRNAETAPIRITLPMRLTLGACIAGMLFLGLYPGPVVKLSNDAVTAFQPAPAPAQTVATTPGGQP
jgi:NADH-quinone oxidoreductase subunit N